MANPMILPLYLFFLNLSKTAPKIVKTETMAIAMNQAIVDMTPKTAKK